MFCLSKLGSKFSGCPTLSAPTQLPRRIRCPKSNDCAIERRSDALVPSSVALVPTSKALVTSSDAPSDMIETLVLCPAKAHTRLPFMAGRAAQADHIHGAP